MQNSRGRHLALLSVASLSLTGLAAVLSGCTQSNSPPADESSSSAANQASSTMASGNMASGNMASGNMDWEMQWAQAALERNPNLEVVSADRELRVFTVRDRHSAQTTEVQLAQIAGTPIAFLTAPGSSEPGTAPTAQPKPEPIAPSEAHAITRFADSSAQPETPLPATQPSTSTKAPNYTIDRSGGRTRVTGDGISVVYGDGPAARRAAVINEPTSPYSVDRSSGLVRINGPGVSIEASEKLRPIQDDALTDAEIEPVICEGPRVMQLDSRNINVDGDALTARGGCELYITNSTIVASGTGIVIGDATVHINNSRIAGGTASFDAKERAKVFLRGSTLNGVPRRAGQALIQDQGGNSFR
jgi:hypothetical protein